uniref:Uncharacterized protein n=1 Tax=Anguilla anguilla TaxID=7936 RepID=A0A0E9V1M9_ANGAN
MRKSSINNPTSMRCLGRKRLICQLGLESTDMVPPACFTALPLPLSSTMGLSSSPNSWSAEGKGEKEAKQKVKKQT